MPSTVVERSFPQVWERGSGVRIPDVLAVSCVGLLLVLTLCVGLAGGPKICEHVSFATHTTWARSQEHSFEQSVTFTAPSSMEETAAVMLFHST